MAQVSLKISELLCYIMCKYGNTPSDNLKSIVETFYSGDEISAAKDMLFMEAGELKADGLPRCILRRKTLGKAKLDVEDILSLIDALDEKQLLCHMPKFVASNLARLPPFNADALDICLLSMRLASLEGQVAGIHKVVDLKISAEISKNIDRNGPQAYLSSGLPGKVSSKIISPEHNNVKSNIVIKASDGSVQTDGSFVPSFAEIAEKLSDDEGFQTVQRRKSGKKPKRIIGNADSMTKLSAAKEVINTEKAIFHVDNLSNNVSADDVVQHLKDSGMDVISCFDTKSFRDDAGDKSVKAFRLCVAKKLAKAVLDCTKWPKGVLVRPWKFKVQSAAMLTNA